MANKYQDIMEQLPLYWPWSKIPQSTMSEEQLDEVESQLGYPLPADYREFLRDYGGYRVQAVYPYVEDGMETHGSFYVAYQGLGLATSYHSTIETMREDHLNAEYPGLSLVRSTLDLEETGWPPELLPIGIDSGGNETCLALFGLHPGAIFHWKNSSGWDKQGVYLIANSFDEFMHLLKSDA